MSKIIKFNKKEKYTKVSNDTLQDDELSFGARGLLSYILSLPSDWNLYITELYNRSPQGRKVIDNLTRELKESGHLIKIVYKSKNGQFKGADWVAFDEVEPLEDVVEFLKTITVDDDVVSAYVEYVGTPININFLPVVPLVLVGKPIVGKGATTNKTYTNKTRTNKTSSSKKPNSKLEEDLFLNLDLKPITKTNIKKYINRTGKIINNQELVSMSSALKKANNYDDFDKAFYSLVKGEWEIAEARNPKLITPKTSVEVIYAQAKEVRLSTTLENAIDFYKTTCKLNGHDYSKGSLGSHFLGNLRLY